MTLEEIQDLINSNQIDLRKLDRERLSILDGLQKKGELQTRPIMDVLNDQKKIADELAAKQTYEEDPLRNKTADILNRDTAQAVFDMGFFGAQLLMDRTRLAKIVANPTKYAGLATKLKDGVFTKGSTNQFSEALKGIDKLSGLDPSKPIGAIMRPVVAATLGYSAGGQAYDIADEIIRAKEGIETRGYKGKDIIDNPFLQAADDLATGLAWNGGAELLAPAAFGGATLVRKFLGLEGDYAKTIKAIAERQGLETSWLEMADPNSIGGRVINYYNKVFGQLPYVGGPAAEAKGARISQFAKRFEDVFNLQPNMHMAELASVSDDVAKQMKSNYERFRGISDVKYDLFRNMSKQFGDPMMIPMAHQRKVYNHILSNNFAPTEFKLTIDNEALQTPIGRFRSAYENLLKANRPISPNEFLELQVLLNDAVARSPNNAKMIGAYKDIRKAMEKDFASINLDPTAEVYLKYPPTNKAIADAVLDPIEPVKTTMGEIKGAAGRKLNQDAINRLKDQLVSANEFYQNNIISFETNLANKMRSSFGKNLFSEKQLAGFFESGTLNADQLAKKLSDNIFMSSANKESFDAVTNLQRLLEADVYKINPRTGEYILEKTGTAEGNKTLKRLFSSYLSDAYQKSFVQRIDSEDFLQSLIGRERTIQEARLPARTISDLKLPQGEAVSKYMRGNIEFDPDTFRKLVLPSEEYAKKFEMVLGPTQGKEMVKQLEDLMGYVTALNKIDVPSSSTYLARRLILTGAQGLGVIGGIYGLGGLGTAALLAMGFFTNKFMVNPQRMKAINGAFKTYLELAEKGEIGLESPLMRRATAKILEVLSSDYPGDPRKFEGKNISTKQLLERLANERYVPDDLKGLHMNKKEKERLFPTVPNNLLSKVLPPPEIDDLFKPVGGTPRNEEEEQIMRTAVSEMPPGPIQQALPRLPGIPVGLVPPTQAQPVSPQKYAAAFPTDTLGILAAQGRTGNV